MPILIFFFLIIFIVATSGSQDLEVDGDPSPASDPDRPRYSERQLADQANKSYRQGRDDAYASIDHRNDYLDRN